MSMGLEHRKFPNGTYILFDDDCGICTKFSKFFKRLVGEDVGLVPMHIPQVEKIGMERIPENYWDSFHIVKNDVWTTEGDAILALATLFPFGSTLRKVAAFPPIYKFLNWFLSQMQAQRKAECKFDF